MKPAREALFTVVPREENIVYIPERCAKRENGDLTKCGDAKG